MYDGFERDLADALHRGEGAVGDFIRDTAKARGLDPFEVFAETARRRLAWDRGEGATPARPRHRRGGQRHGRVSGLLRQLWPRRQRTRRRGSLLRRVRDATLGVAGRQLRKASKRLLAAGARAARRRARQIAQQLHRSSRRFAAGAGRFAYGLGFWLVRRRWPTPKETRRGPDARRPVPQPSPAVAALLDGYTFREATYLFSDPHVRDPHDDWPGALRDFHQAVRTYVTELQRYAEEDARDQHRSSRDHRPGPHRNPPPARRAGPDAAPRR